MPISSKKVLFLLAAPCVALGGCSVTVGSTNGDAGSDAAPTTTGTDSGTTLADAGGAGADDGASADGGASAEAGKLGFVPSNLPSGMALAAPGDWVFSSQRCGGRTTVQIDTSKGTSDCDGKAAPYQYSAITQSDMSLGSLQAAVFVTNKFTVETGMQVTVVGNLPLIVVALGDANISGILSATVNDVSSDKANGGGASGGPHNANGSGPGGGTAPVGASGAGGGAFCGMGGDGPGVGDAGAMGGKTYGAATNVPLVGGSAGGSGSYGAGGGGGGAIQIASASSIQVTAIGAINVAGGGGNWSRSGGGSGGAILLQAP
ncbi:MAG: hypothetical protein M3O50_02635 [Myxococcota bacterium]|nr:hypothetical protein [Myxococcota bacterium]